MSKKEGFELEEVSIRLIKEKNVKERYKIQSPEEAIKYVGDKIRMLDREVACVINLKASGEPINFSIVSIGILNEALVSPRELLKSSILSNASNIIMLHNHPSGSLIPSGADIKLTDRMIQVCDLVSIPLLDHIIVGPEYEDEYYSFEKKDKIRHRQTLTTDINELKFAHSNAAEQNIVEEYRTRTKELFHPINDIYADNFEDTVYYYINSILEEDYPAIEIVDVVLVGSRSRGIERNGSDLDFVFEYVGEMHEDELFNILNSNSFKILGIDIDINPIRREETGTLKDYLPKAEIYLQEKKQKMSDELINKYNSIMNTHGYPIYGDGFVSFPEEYDDVFTKDELKRLEELILNQKGLIPSKNIVTKIKEEEQYMAKDNPISIWVGNLRKYNEGKLDGKWLALPMTDEQLKRELDEISLNGRDEIMIFDTDTREDCRYMYDAIGEFDSIHEVNVVAKLIGKDEHPSVEMFIEYSGRLSMSEIANLLYQEDEIPFHNYDFDGIDNQSVLTSISNEAKLGYTMIEQDVALKKLLEDTVVNGTTLYSYINVFEVGRDAVLSGYVEVGDTGYLYRDSAPDLEKYSVEDINKDINEKLDVEKQKSQEITPKTKYVPEPTPVGPKL